MKIYPAARYGRREEMAQISDYLKSKGFEITARWVYGGEEGLSREDIALLDFEDVDKADVVLSFTERRGTANVAGGRHVEFGYGLAKGKRMVVIGERETVFHEHPDAEVYPSLEEWLKAENEG